MHQAGGQVPINIRRLIWHVGYTGYIITKAAKSEYMPQLQIIDDDLFAKANERMDSHYKNAAENKNAARKSDNPCLLAGIIVCAHCGAKMWAFLHKDRYKLADGTIKENVQAKYNCYQRGQHLRPCDGQALYLTERVDSIVLDLVEQMFQSHGRSIEQRIRQRAAELNRKSRPPRRKSRQPSTSSSGTRKRSWAERLLVNYVGTPDSAGGSRGTAGKK